jgi:hypothetical protein
MLLMLLYDQICVTYQWNRKYRENRRKNHKPDDQSSDPLVYALLTAGIFGRYFPELRPSFSNALSVL